MMLSRRRDNPEYLRLLGLAYCDAKQVVIDAGYAWEIDQQYAVALSGLTERAFLAESAWVILCSGMREAVIRKHFDRISTAFLEWSSAKEITANANRCRRAALQHFAHLGKINAILEVSARVYRDGFAAFHKCLAEEGVQYLRSLPYLGPATALHLAKNIGIGVAKPDRHLLRIARRLKYGSVAMLCGEIADIVQEPIAVVDIVLWRYSTLDKELAVLPRARRTSGAPTGSA
jgi:hypothetical protein